MNYFRRVWAFFSFAFFAIFLITNIFLDWSKILNAREVPISELNLLVIIVFGFFALRLTFKLIVSIFLANQQPAIKDMIDTSSKVLNLIIIFALLQTTRSKLLYLGISYSASPILILIIVTLIFFTGKFKQISPSIKFVDFSLFGDLFKLSGKFFIIQIAAVILFTTDYMIITQLYSPAAVVPYSITREYFGVLMIKCDILL